MGQWRAVSDAESFASAKSHWFADREFADIGQDRDAPRGYRVGVGGVVCGREVMGYIVQRITVERCRHCELIVARRG